MEMPTAKDVLPTPRGSDKKDRGLAIEEITDLLIDNIIESQPVIDEWGRFNPNGVTFGPLLPLGFYSEWDDADDRWWFPPEEFTPDVLWPFDVTTVTPHCGEWVINRTFSCRPSLARGRVRIVPKYLVQTRCGFLTPGRSSMEINTRFIGWVNNAWRAVDTGLEYCTSTNSVKGSAFVGGICRDDEKKKREHDDVTRMAQSFAFRMRYLWQVDVGVPDGPMVRFETDPSGTMEIFKDRDLAADKTRRTALRNWVKQHWRRRRSNDSEADIFVRKHLRGATQFWWRGFRCRVTPPQCDIDAIKSN